MGHVLAQLGDALLYIPEGRGFDFRWCHYDFSLTILPAALRPWGLTQPLTEMRTRNISLGVKGGRCVGLTTLLPSCADCLEIWKPQPDGTRRACPELQWDCFASTHLLTSIIASETINEGSFFLNYTNKH
jgi:hypothetical protein